MALSVIDEEIQDYLEYLVEFNGIKKEKDLNREQRNKLFEFLLIKQNKLVQLMRWSNALIKNEVQRHEGLQSAPR